MGESDKLLSREAIDAEIPSHCPVTPFRPMKPTPAPQPYCHTCPETDWPCAPFMALTMARAYLDLRESLKQYQAMIAEEARDTLNDAASRKLFQRISIGLGSILLAPPPEQETR